MEISTIKRIALISNSVPFDGGSNSYENSFIKELEDFKNEKYELILINTKKKSHSNSNPSSEKVFKISGLTKLRIALMMSEMFAAFLARTPFRTSKFEKFLIGHEVDLAIFLSPNPLALVVESVPFISTVWDFGHRDLPWLSEFSNKNNFREREFFYANTLPRSHAVFVDSDSTRRACVNYYKIQEENIFVIGLLPRAPIGEISPERLVKSKYIFYPAQFWPHKNHMRLLLAFQKLLRSHPELLLVFTGSDKGSLNQVLNLTKELGIQDNVVYLGFVDRADYWNILFHSELLVFPTLLGPTNLPPLEAAIIRKKICLSGFHAPMFNGDEDMVNFFDPYFEEEIFKALKTSLSSDSNGVVEINSSALISIHEAIKINLEKL